jgi:hypothetical protein
VLCLRGADLPQRPAAARTAEAMRARGPRAVGVTIEGCGHAPALNTPIRRTTSRRPRPAASHLTAMCVRSWVRRTRPSCSSSTAANGLGETAGPTRVLVVRNSDASFVYMPLQDGAIFPGAGDRQLRRADRLQRQRAAEAARGGWT